MTIAIIGIAAAMSYTILTYVLTTIRSDSALQGMVAQMRQARQASLDQRRNVLVTFQGTGELVALRQNLDLSTTPLSDYFLPNGVVYMVSPGVPDTPDGYGNAKAVNFNCASLPCTITFQSDGSVLDSTGNYVNGTVFIGKASQTLAARAVTILGATGRIKGYRYNGSAWL